jgi:hypothetical protein
MRLRFKPVGYLALAAACLSATALVAQTDKSKCTWTGVNGKPVTDLCAYAPPGAKLLNPPPATQTPAPAPTAQAFPFPGEPPSDNTQNASAPQNPSVQAGAPTPSAADASTPASKRFPFPGESPDLATPTSPATPAPNPNGLHDAGSQGESTKPAPGESSSSSSSSGTNLPPDASDSNDPPDAAPIPHHSRRPLPTVKEQTPDEREAEDVSVAAFYMNLNNFQGAYMRGKDAVSLDDTDPEAHLALAEAARKLGKLDEAEQHYKRCLELDPLPKDRKVAAQALKEMTGKG